MYQQELENLGLSQKEAKVYVTALELGAETAQNIANKANVNRATTYVQIESLKAKGLISEFEKGKKTFYVAESPHRLHGLLKVFAAELEMRKGDLDRILTPLLDLFAGMGDRPKVRFFEGVEGINLMREDFGKIKGKQIYSIINKDKMQEFSPNMAVNYVNYRVARKIPIKVIYTSQNGPIKGYSDPAVFRQAKFLEYEKFPIMADITIYDDKTVIEGYGSKIIGVIIESQPITQTLKAIFTNLWERLE